MGTAIADARSATLNAPLSFLVTANSQYISFPMVSWRFPTQVRYGNLAITFTHLDLDISINFAADPVRRKVRPAAGCMVHVFSPAG